jgi:hypothetical protein
LPAGGIGEANAVPGRRYQVRQLGGHNRHVQPGNKIAETGVNRVRGSATYRPE